MIEKFKGRLKSIFSNSPKAKILILIIATVVIIASITVISARKTVVVNIDGKQEKIVTYNGTVKDVLNSKGIKIDNKDKIQPSLEDKVQNNSTISVKKAVLVELTVGDKKVKLNTAEDTIEKALESSKEELKSQDVVFNKGVDEVTPALNTKVTSGLNIDLVKVEVKHESKNEDIAFDTVVESDSNIDSGVEQVRQKGVSGQKEVTYEVVYKSGKESSRKVKSSKVIAEPVSKVVAKGSKMTIANRGQSSLGYKSVVYCQATAYTGGGITATGVPVSRNPNGTSTIAVDPRVIPLGSLVYVEGYGRAVAADTGGAIKGNIIDLYVDSEGEAIQHGRQYNVPVYILAGPGQW